MPMIRAATAVPLLLLALAADAQVERPRDQPGDGAGGAFCGAAGEIVRGQQLRRNPEGFTGAEVHQRCEPGDTIAIPGAVPAAVAVLCDFTKAVTPTGGAVACVLAPPRVSKSVPSLKESAGGASGRGDTR